jgi:NAD(P) transhydrogenase subunit alpha
VSEAESRVALVPRTVKQLVSKGLEVLVQAGAGLGAYHADAAFQQAGATILTDVNELYGQADVVLVVHPPAVDDVKSMKRGSVLAGMFAPAAHPPLVEALTTAGITSFSMEFLPRISRAQAMDVLSSQANIAGYKAVILAAENSAKMFPMMITAAGTIAPARVFVIGAGVAGLQAIATAKRLGAIVEAFDVRAATKEQVQSLGGRFVELPTAKQDDAATGGYAKEQSDEQRRQQVELMTKHVVGASCVITTAAVFGKAPPLLIPKDMVEQMSPGSVIVDLAADAKVGRGNCELTQPNHIIVTDNGVAIVGKTNMPSLLATDASHVFAGNMAAFLTEITQDKALKIDVDDEVQRGALITHDGQVMNEAVKAAMEEKSK